MLSNNERLKLVASGLGELCDSVVFVGGCVAQLYATDQTLADARPTDDVDCVVNLSSYSDYSAFSEMLRSKRFSNSMQPGDPICRWSFQDEIVDIMPCEDSPIGPSNRWYKPGMRHKIVYEVSEGIMIQLLPVIYYVATKLDAIRSRGGSDLRFSHDFEDLVFVLNYSGEFKQQFSITTDTELKSYLIEQFRGFLNRPYIREEVSCSLTYGESEEADRILQTMKFVADG